MAQDGGANATAHRRSPTADGGSGGGSGRTLAIGLVLGLFSVLLMLPAARLPDRASGAVAAVFAPGHDATAVYGAIVAAGGVPVRSRLGGLVWVARSDAAGFAGRLRAAGALTVVDPVVAAGCLGSGGPATAVTASGPPGGRAPDPSRAFENRG